ncbi:hypothetical protein CN503_25795 [Bacillus cereus]|nr:hypothetical protein CN503_25795 [Bacillus cereus]PFM01459.1 hypothetical protein COJ39_29250 [Bacillus cereus]
MIHTDKNRVKLMFDAFFYLFTFILLNADDHKIGHIILKTSSTHKDIIMQKVIYYQKDYFPHMTIYSLLL